MFGISAFGQTTYASLANNAYILSISEGFTPADVISISKQFFVTQTENFNPAETETIAAQFASSISEGFSAYNTDSEVAIFYEGIVETFTSAESYVVSWGTFESIVEGSKIADIETMTAQFKVSDVENLYAGDGNITGGWISIIDSQIANWNNINDAQTVTWSDVGDASTVNWVPVDDTQ